MIVYQEPVVHSWANQKLAIVSGLSNPNCCRLSFEQYAFMDELKSVGYTKIFLNFPYVDRDSSNPIRSAPQEMPSLLQASWANSSQFLRTQFSGFRQELQKHWRAVTASCEQLSLISISSGLELINACVQSTADTCRLRVLAIGPVSLRQPAVPCVKIVGSRDWIANCFMRAVDHGVDHRVKGVGHLDYLRSGEVKRIVEDWICSNTFEY